MNFVKSIRATFFMQHLWWELFLGCFLDNLSSIKAAVAEVFYQIVMPRNVIKFLRKYLPCSTLLSKDVSLSLNLTVKVLS